MKKTISTISILAILVLSLLAFGCGTAEDQTPAPEEEVNELQAKYAPAMIHVEITEEDLSQGWYYGDVSEKKANTPDDWMWIKDQENEENSKWMKPPVEEMMDY